MTVSINLYNRKLVFSFICKTTFLSTCLLVNLQAHALLTRQLVNSSTCQPANQCKFFSKNFNIMSAFVIHQPPTRPQKIDSREG